jgi:hypothetical protein
MGRHLPCQSFKTVEFFVDREYWKTINDTVVKQKQSELNAFVEKVKAMQTPTMTGERGIVFMTGSSTFARALVSVRILRRILKCKLPIEIWFLTGELSVQQIVELQAEPGVEAMEIASVLAMHPFRSLLNVTFDTNSDTSPSSQKYDLKSLVLILTRFQYVLYLDSDNMPVNDPGFLFETPEFLEYGALFWPDFWKYPADHPMWKIIGLPCEDEHEQESGQLVLDKQRHWLPLLVAFHFQHHHDFYFRIMMGDKDSYRFAWKWTGGGYLMNPHPPAMVGRVRQDQFCGYSMLQHDFQGGPLFVHANLLKRVYARPGITFESVQYLTAKKPERREIFDDVVYFVNYPETLQLKSGVQKPALDGGSDGEAVLNPCLAYVMHTDTQIKVPGSLADADEIWSYDLHEVFLSEYHAGSLMWLEKAYYEFGGPESESQYNKQ